MDKIKIAEWFGTVTSIIGSFLVSFAFYRMGYVCFFMGAIAWLGVAFITKNRALFVLNCFFGVANLIGLYRAFIV